MIFLKMCRYTLISFRILLKFKVDSLVEIRFHAPSKEDGAESMIKAFQQVVMTIFVVLICFRV